MKILPRTAPTLTLAALFAGMLPTSLSALTVLSTDSAVTAANSGPGEFTLTDQGPGNRDGIYSYAFNAGADSDMLVVSISTEASGEAWTVSYDGVAMTLATQSSVGSGTSIFYLANPSATGSIAIDYTGKSVVNGIGLGIASLDGEGQAIVFDNGVSASGVDIIDITPNFANSFVMFAGDSNSTAGSAPTLDSPLTSVRLAWPNDIGSNAAAAGYENGVAASLQTYSWNPASNPRGISAAAFSVGGPPAISSLTPPDDGTDVVGNTDPVLTFNKAVALTGNGTVTIKNLDAATQVTINLSSLPDAGNDVTVSGADLTILPAADFAAGTHYAIQISADAVEDLNPTPNAFAGILDDTTWDFFIDGTAPGIAALSPADEATDVYLGTELVLTFDEAVALTGSGSVTIIEDPAGTPTNTVINLPDASVTLNGLDLTIVPASNLNAGSTYAVNISNDAVEDLSGNAFAGILDTTTWNFATVALDATAPVISTKDPADDATEVSVFTPIVATFDDDLVLGSGNITIYNVTLGSAAATIDVTDTSQVSLAGSVLTINPTAALDVSTEYAVQLDAGVVRNLNDLPNAAINDTTTWSFTTQAFATYTWIQGGVPTSWADPDNWLGGAVPPQTTPGTVLVFSASTSGDISNVPSGADTNKVTVGSVTWETDFNMQDFGTWNDTDLGWIIDSGVPEVPVPFTFSNGGFMGNRYGTWTLNSDLLLSGTGAGGGMQVQAASSRVVGIGGFIVEAGTLKFDNTHLDENYPYTGGVTVRNNGVVDVNTTNEALGEGALTVEEGGQVQLAGDNLDNNADLISLVVLSAGANPATNKTFLTGSPTFVDGFTFDLSSAGTTVGNQWQIATATASYDAAFTVASTVAGAWSETAGVWSGSENGVTYEFDTSTGILEVTDGSSGTPYENWATGGELFGDDANGDGVSNGMAFLLGASGPNADANGLLPTVSEDGSGGLELTFTMLDSASRGTAALSIEHSSDLGIGDAWTPVMVPDTTQVVGGVDFQVSGSGTLSVVATIPSSEAAAGKLFGRLLATGN